MRITAEEEHGGSSERNKMNRTAAAMAALLFAAGCAKPQETPDRTHTPDAEEYTGKTVIITEDVVILKPEDPDIRYMLNEGLYLHLAGSERKTPYSPDETCMEYDSVILEGSTSSHLEIFENMPVKINSVYGGCTLQKMDEMYLMMFNPAAQIGGISAVLFDDTGNVHSVFDNVEIIMNTEDETKFLVCYVCGRDGEHCVFEGPEPESDLYDIEGKEVLITHFAGGSSGLDILLQETENAGALAAYADLGQQTGSPMETAEASPFALKYPFILNVDAAHTAADEGSEVFCIVPAEPGASVAVNVYRNLTEPEVLYRSEEGSPVLVLAEYDGDSPLTEVVVTTSKGTVSFFLAKNMEEDPRLYRMHAENSVSEQIMLDELLSYHPDLERYAADPDNFRETAELEGTLCHIAYFGTVQPTGQFTREKTFAVSEDGMIVFVYDAVTDTWYREER